MKSFHKHLEDKLLKVCPPHLADIVQGGFKSPYSWLNQTKNSTTRGVPLNRAEIKVLSNSWEAFEVLFYL